MRRLALCCLLACLGTLALATTAQAEFGLTDFDVTFTDSEGETVSQAGAHPFQMDTEIRFITVPTEKGGEEIEEAPKDIVLTQMPGFVGNPTAVPTCSTVDFLTKGTSIGGETIPDCPDATAVGITSVLLADPEIVGSIYGAVYNLAPPPGKAAKLGFWIKGVPVTVELGVTETPPYNIIGGPTNISQLVEVVGATFTLWGTPAAPAHDPLRGRCINPTTGESDGTCQANISEVPFLTLPRSCQGPQMTRYRTASWQNPTAFKEGSAQTHNSLGEPEGFKGCGKLGFDPSVAVRPTTAAAESASGLDLEIDVEDEGMANPTGTAKADIEATRFAFPPGVTVNPSAAEGLGVCTEAQFEAASLAEQGCPDASKLGTLEVQTPILEDRTLRGVFYQAAQYENPFGSLLGAYLTIKDEELGVFVKLAAKITTDPTTGQIVTEVEDMPPFPLSGVKVHLRSGPRAPLTTPPTCGTYTTEALLYPSSGAPPLAADSDFAITSGPGGAPCPPALPPLVPGFEAGSTNSAASHYSPFTMRLTRPDGSQDLTRFSATLPPGVTGKIAGVPRCPDAAIEAAEAKRGRAELAAPSCPAASQVGRVLGGAGVGTALTYVPGSLYLAGPYKGAPISIAAIVPAVAGPFDVGTVVTRVGLQLNPNTGQVEVDGAASDPIPHILEGIPLKLRDLRVSVDRPGFTSNPTSCEPLQTLAEIFGSGADPFNPADDAPVGASARYRASSCASLGFAPKVSVSLRGGMKRDKHPALTTTVTYPYPSGPGYANIGKAVITLPPTEFIDNAHISNPCTRAQFAAEACPPKSVLGTARAITPLLDEPFEGNVYFRSNGGERLLPDLAIDLRGGGFRFVAVVAVKSRKGRLSARVLNTPDVPVTSFTVRLKGGRQGLLVNSADLCKKKRRFSAELTGQNGREHDTEPVLGTSCKKKKGSRSR